MRFRSLSMLLGCLPVCAFSQETLSLEEALQLAKANNGTIRSALVQTRISQSQVNRAASAFYPSLTPSLRWNSQRTETATGFGTQAFEDDRTTTQAVASWRILDSGERDLNLRGTRRSLDSQRLYSLQTLRETLFLVHRQYYNALRAEELQKVADAQVGRANLILEQTKARVEVRDAAAKDILQAQADALNARVASLQASNRTASAAAELKATLGLPADRPLPALEALDKPAVAEQPQPLPEHLAYARSNRADLESRRKSLESLDFTLRRQRTEAGLSFGLDGNLDQQFSPDRLFGRNLTFLASYPLFDGGYSREVVRETRLRIDADRALLDQAERQAMAEVESVYVEFIQNQERLEASEAAVEAARANYNAAVEAQRLGAGDLIEILTAQVSLVTAESNAIEALYDLVISDASLRLVTGRPIAGEEGLVLKG